MPLLLVTTKPRYGTWRNKTSAELGASSLLARIPSARKCCGILYTVNMCCYNWLINNAVLAYDKAGQSQIENPSRET